MGPIAARRRRPRAVTSPSKLVAEFDGARVDVVHISTMGCRLSGGPSADCGTVEFTLTHRDGDRGTRVSGVVVGRDKSSVDIRFSKVGYDLARLIVSEAAHSLGQKPYLVK